MFLLKRKYPVALLVLLVLAAGAIVGGAQSIPMPTYYYYGRELPPQELLALHEAGHVFHCTDLPTVSGYLNSFSNAYACFDTEAERDAYSEVIQPEWARIYREYPAPQFPRSTGGS